MTPLESLKAKAEKKKAELKELEKQVKDAEVAERKREEQAVKLEALSPQISEAIEAILKKEKITLPEGKQIISIVGSNGDLFTNIVNGKPVRTKAGNGGAKTITFEGQQISWAKLCELKNVVRTPSGSAHRDVFNRAKELHDSIPHTCLIDNKTYPVA